MSPGPEIMIINQFFNYSVETKNFSHNIFLSGFSFLPFKWMLFRTAGQEPKHVTKVYISWLSSSVRPAGTIKSFSLIFCLSQWFNFCQNPPLTSLITLVVLEHLCFHKTKLLCVPQRTEGRSRTPQGWARWSMPRLSQQANHTKLFREENPLLVLFSQMSGDLLSNPTPKPSLLYAFKQINSQPSSKKDI